MSAYCQECGCLLNNNALLCNSCKQKKKDEQYRIEQEQKDIQDYILYQKEQMFQIQLRKQKELKEIEEEKLRVQKELKNQQEMFQKKQLNIIAEKTTQQQQYFLHCIKNDDLPEIKAMLKDGFNAPAIKDDIITYLIYTNNMQLTDYLNGLIPNLKNDLKKKEQENQKKIELELQENQKKAELELLKKEKIITDSNIINLIKNNDLISLRKEIGNYSNKFKTLGNIDFESLGKYSAEHSSWEILEYLVSVNNTLLKFINNSKLYELRELSKSKGYSTIFTYCNDLIIKEEQKQLAIKKAKEEEEQRQLAVKKAKEEEEQRQLAIKKAKKEEENKINISEMIKRKIQEEELKILNNKKHNIQQFYLYNESMNLKKIEETKKMIYVSMYSGSMFILAIITFFLKFNYESVMIFNNYIISIAFLITSLMPLIFYSVKSFRNNMTLIYIQPLQFLVSTLMTFSMLFLMTFTLSG